MWKIFGETEKFVTKRFAAIKAALKWELSRQALFPIFTKQILIFKNQKLSYKIVCFSKHLRLLWNFLENYVISSLLAQLFATVKLFRAICSLSCLWLDAFYTSVRAQLDRFFRVGNGCLTLSAAAMWGGGGILPSGSLYS